MNLQLDRPILPAETAVIVAALANAPVSPNAAMLVESVSSLHAVSGCDCGCGSIDFTTRDQPNSPIADGVGTTASGNEVGVLVWGTTSTITALEIYSLAECLDRGFPMPQSIRPFPAARS
jgi:hypothetical protein